MELGSRSLQDKASPDCSAAQLLFSQFAQGNFRESRALCHHVPPIHSGFELTPGHSKKQSQSFHPPLNSGGEQK